MIRRGLGLLWLCLPVLLLAQEPAPSPSVRFRPTGLSDSARLNPRAPRLPKPAPTKSEPGEQGVADLPLPADSSATDSPHKRVKIINADRLTFQKRGDTAVQKLIGHVRLAQDSTYFFCDSAYLYERDNRLKAFSRVRIEMPDSVLLTSDRLTYDGNTRIAEVYNRILLTDGQSRLNTDRLTYYRAEEYGYYQGGGKLVDDSTVLTSKTGYYYPNRKEAFFRGDVVLTHPDYTLSTDTLGYDTETKVARFVTLTTIVNEDGTIETTRGSYDTQKANIDLFQRSQVRDSSYTLIADTLLYTDGRSLGLARGRVIVIQEDSSLELRGNYGRFNRETDESFITGDAVAIQRMDGDTLYMFADTLFSLKDTQYVDRQQRKAAKLTQLTRSLVDSLRRDSVAQDSLMPPPTIVIDSAMAIEGSALDSLGLIAIADSLAKDSLGLDSLPLGPPTLADFEQRFDTVTKRRFIGYHHVRFFMNDMQGLADSMVYDYDDSLLYLYTDPILWSDDNQLTGDTITVWMKNEQADSMQVSGHSFMASQADTVGYNQLKGRNMQLKFRDNDLYRVRMIGNTESIYFIEADQDSSLRDSLPPAYQGMNKALANEMLIYFAAREVSKIVFLSKPEGIFFPFYEVVFQENALDGLNWRGEERPRKPLWLLPPRPIIDSVAPLPDVLSLPLVPRNPLPSPEAQSLPPATPALLPEEQP